MCFKKIALASSFIVLFGSIVVPGNRSVNHPAPATQGSIELTDGMPLPPPPRGIAEETLIADGMPLPPPPRLSDENLLADGMPLPPPPPPRGGALDATVV